MRETLAPTARAEVLRTTAAEPRLRAIAFRKVPDPTANWEELAKVLTVVFPSINPVELIVRVPGWLAGRKFSWEVLTVKRLPTLMPIGVEYSTFAKEKDAL